MNNPVSTVDIGDAAADVAELVAIVAIALSLEHNPKLRMELRQCAGSQADQPLRLQLPIGRAVIEILPAGELRPLRPAESVGSESLNRLLADHAATRDQMIALYARASQDAREIVLPFVYPGRIPSRTEFKQLQRWAPLIELSAYKFGTRAMSELDIWRASAIREATEGAVRRDTVISRYYALSHTLAHLTIICSDPGARTWLVEMAKSFTWINWTPTFPLVRERTVWLAAAAARSAAAFGPEIVDRYLRKLADASHAYAIFDALFGLVAIACSDHTALEAIVRAIVVDKNKASNRGVVGVEHADVAYRSAIRALRNWRDGRDPSHQSLAQLAWDTKSSRGLSTREAFRLDPSDVAPNGDMLGFAVLPAIMRATPDLHYPCQSAKRSPLLPKLKELPELMTRAWGSERDVAGRTIH